MPQSTQVDPVPMEPQLVFINSETQLSFREMSAV